MPKKLTLNSKTHFSQSVSPVLYHPDGNPYRSNGKFVNLPTHLSDNPDISPSLPLEQTVDKPQAIKFLLFVDKRAKSQKQAKQITEYLQTLKGDYPFDLEIIDLQERPDLVEHFRLVASPSLVKLYPNPRQILVGTDVVLQLERLWASWKQEVHNQQNQDNASQSLDNDSPSILEDHSHNNGFSPDHIYLTEEIFRLKKEKQELLEKLQFKDQVLAMLAHDLRSPLTAASIALDTLELAEKKPDHEKTTQLSKQLFKQTKTQFRVMNRMITDILQAAKGSSSFNLRLQNLDLPLLCNDLLKQLTETLRSKSLYLHKDIPQDIPPVYGDVELIRQVITNLLENAIKYTPQGGKISFSVLHRTTQKIQISICDNGPGIPEETKERIFEGHFRLKRDEAKEGYGIGLALCRQVIQAHYGQIWVDSEPNSGSCFHFTLPVYR